MIRAIERKPIRFSKKAETATSLDALKVAGATPPAVNASRARRRQGNRSGSGGWKSSEKASVKFTVSSTPGARSGKSRACWMGKVIDGGLNWAYQGSFDSVQRYELGGWGRACTSVDPAKDCGLQVAGAGEAHTAVELDDGTLHLLVGASPAQFPARLLSGSAERDLADLDQLMGVEGEDSDDGDF